MERSHGVQRGQTLVGEDFFKMFNGELVLEVEHMVDKEVEFMVDKVDKEDLGEMASSSLLGQHRLLIVPRAWLRLPRKRLIFFGLQNLLRWLAGELVKSSEKLTSSIVQ